MSKADGDANDFESLGWLLLALMAFAVIAAVFDGCSCRVVVTSRPSTSPAPTP